MKTTLLLGFVIFSLQSRAQSPVSTVTPSTFNAGGGTTILSRSFMVDWSIGESTIVETFFGQTFNVTSGVLQPFDSTHIIFNTLIPFWTKEEIRVYPVPTSGNVTIDFRSVTTGKISMQLMNVNGTVLGSREFLQVSAKSTQTWDLSNSASGNYYLRILLDDGHGNTLKQGIFKVEKIK